MTDNPTGRGKLIGAAAVHPIGIGTWDMGGSRLPDGNIFADYRDDDRDIEAIRYSISRGQNHIDTAQLYGAGHTEEIVGEAISGLERSSLFIATKVWRSHSLRHAVTRSVEESLRKLGTDYVDLLYVHSAWDAIEMSEYIGGMNDAVDAGLARALAVSNFSLEQLERAIKLSKHPIVAIQLHYNILERSSVPSKLLSFCSESKITVVAYRPVERTLLTGTPRNATVAHMAEKYRRPASQIAINWLIGQPGVVTIPKASSRKHIDENLGALEFELTPEDRAELDRCNGT